MSDDRLKETFRVRAGDKRERLRDRDNAAPRPAPPVFVSRPAPNMAPPGTLGIRRGLPVAQARQAAEPVSRPLAETFRSHSTPQRDRLMRAGIEITGGDPDRDSWISGRFRDQPQYLFMAKINALPSGYGIGGGRVAELELLRNGRPVAHYRRKWNVRPEEKANRDAVNRLCKAFDGRDRTPPAHVQPKRSIDRER